MRRLIAKAMFVLSLAWITIEAPQKISREEQFRLLMEEVYDFLENPVQDKQKLDHVLQSGELGGFYTAYEYFDFIKSLHSLYPNYITNSIACGKSYQSRELKAYRIGDLSRVIRKPRGTISDPPHCFAPRSGAAWTLDGSAHHLDSPASTRPSKESGYEGQRRNRP
jgi:hypothetical protein